MEQKELENLGAVYNHLGDELSKEIFENRVMYSISQGDMKYANKIIRSNAKLDKMLQQIEMLAVNNEIAIFGCGVRGKETKNVLPGVGIKCFIDNNPTESTICGIPVYKYTSFAKAYTGEYIIISSVRYFEEMFSQLVNDGFPEDKIINLGKVLHEIKQDQYFDLKHLKRNKEETFVDLGCYDGATSLNFVKWCQEAERVKVIAFEPDSENIKKCKKNFEDNNIHYRLINKGAWKERTTLFFDKKEAMDSCISDTGESVIEVTSLDDELLHEKISFIKMDIEGAEKQALFGSKQVIKQNHPKLAISVYHRFDDIFEIPELILSFNPDYKLYLRHYCINPAETILYAIPD